MVSHSEYVKKYADEVLKIENGKLVGVNKWQLLKWFVFHY